MSGVLERLTQAQKLHDPMRFASYGGPAMDHGSAVADACAAGAPRDHGVV